MSRSRDRRWAGEGLALLDPHGDLVERIVAAVPASRRDDLLYWNVPDAEGPFGFKPAEFFHLDAAEAEVVKKAPQVKF